MTVNKCYKYRLYYK